MNKNRQKKDINENLYNHRKTFLNITTSIYLSVHYFFKIYKRYFYEKYSYHCFKLIFYFVD